MLKQSLLASQHPTGLSPSKSSPSITSTAFSLAMPKSSSLLHPLGVSPTTSSLLRQMTLLKRGLVFLSFLTLLSLSVAVLCILELTGITSATSFSANALLTEASVTQYELANSSVLSRHLAEGAVVNTSIANASILQQHISSGSVGTNQLRQFSRGKILRSPNLPQPLFSGRAGSHVNSDFCRLDAADRPVCLDTASSSLVLLRCHDVLCWSGWSESVVELDGYIQILDFALVGSRYPSDMENLYDEHQEDWAQYDISTSMPVILYSKSDGAYISQCLDESCSRVTMGAILMKDVYLSAACLGKISTTEAPSRFSYLVTDGDLSYSFGYCMPLTPSTASSSSKAYLACLPYMHGYTQGLGIGRFKVGKMGQFTVSAGLNLQGDKSIGFTLAVWDSMETYYGTPLVLEHVALQGVSHIYDVLVYNDFNAYDREVLVISITFRQEEEGAYEVLSYTYTYVIQDQELQDNVYMARLTYDFPYGLSSVVDEDMVPIQVKLFPKLRRTLSNLQRRQIYTQQLTCTC